MRQVASLMFPGGSPPLARSQYVYVVDYQGGPMVAAFTVKHELVTWLRRHRSDTMWPVYRVTRLRDGLNYSEESATLMSVAGLIGEPKDTVDQ